MNSLPEPNTLFDLSGRIALIAGASGAFGYECARALAGAGASVAAAGVNQTRLEALADDVTASGGKLVVIEGRPTGTNAAAALIDGTVRAFGQVDILVSAQGINRVSEIGGLSESSWDEVMDVNVRQTWLLCQAFRQHLEARQAGGKAILLSSARASLGMYGYSAYCPSKAAVNGLVKALAVEWGAAGINVNAIAPTVFRSDLTAWMYEDTERGATARSNITSRIPLGRLGEPADFHGAVQFLASRASDFMTGAVLAVDGGYSAG